MEARRANDLARVKTYYQQEYQIIPPPQQEKIRTYLHEHPVTVTESAPGEYSQTVWETYPTGPDGVVVTPGGAAVVPGTAVVPGAAPAAAPSGGVRVDTPVGSVSVGGNP